MNTKLKASCHALAILITVAGCAAPSADTEGEGTAAAAVRDRLPAGTPLVSTIALNQRQQPMQSAALVQVIPSGTTVLTTAADRAGAWREITLNGLTGWVVTDYLERSPGAGGAAGATPEPAASSAAVSERGRRQMRDIVAYADAHDSGASRGRCFEYVWNYLSSSGYGTIDSYGDAADMPSAYARHFAEYMNANGNAARWGLQRLPLDNPYDAPVGAVVVVAAGSPGTAHPTAGDISIAAGGGRFINDGPQMSYGGSSAAFRSRGGRVLGIYVPR